MYLYYLVLDKMIKLIQTDKIYKPRDDDLFRLLKTYHNETGLIQIPSSLINHNSIVDKMYALVLHVKDR